MTNNGEVKLGRIAVILLFAMTFTLIGWVSPVLYATYTPDNQVIEAHSFTAQDVNPEAEQHHICFDRTVYQQSSGQVFTELYLVSDGDPDNRTEIESRSMERYFQGGRATVETPLDLPEQLEEGTYRYLLVIQMDMADGRVERLFTFESEPFMASNDVPMKQSERPPACT